MDKDGNSKLSPIIKIKISSSGGFAVVNPNPFKDNLKVNIESASQDRATLIITDISGRQLLKQNRNLFAGQNLVEISEAGKLAKGSYLLTITSTQQKQNIRIVKGN